MPQNANVPPHPARWLLLADTGGTFTDVLARTPEGFWRRLKVLSSGVWRIRVVWNTDGSFTPTPAFPWAIDLSGFQSGTSHVHPNGTGGWQLLPQLEHQPAWLDLSTGEEAPVLGMRLLTGTPANHTPPPCEFRLATTRATNALLEGRAAPVAVFLTEGFEDLLEIGTQQRPDLFSLSEPEPARTVPTVGVPGRLDAHGSEITPPAIGTWVDRARELLQAGIRDAAICLLHAHRNPAHEHLVASLLREIGFERITCSADLSPLPRYLVRTQTTLIHASLVPVMDAYLDGVEAPLRESRLLVMTSAGALEERGMFRARDSLMSGPAGGLNATAALGRACGESHLVAFDMGGTSTDVARIDRTPARKSEVRVGPHRLQAPSLHVESVAAGGGSICDLGADGLRVGPQSAGSDPGPACYGRGGPLTVTDLHLILGRIRPELFAFPPDAAAARNALEKLHRRCEAACIPIGSPEQLAVRLLDLANETMAGALRAVTLREGHDPSGHAMVAYGGAGGLHACELAMRLGIETVLIPLNAGLFSAEGLGHTAIERIQERSLATLPVLEAERALEGAIESNLAALPASFQNAPYTHEVFLRRRGHDYTVHVPWTGVSEEAARKFTERYRNLFGLEVRASEVEVCGLRTTATWPAAVPVPESFSVEPQPVAYGHLALLHVDHEAEQVPTHHRASLIPGNTLAGPAVVQDGNSTFWLPRGWTCEVGNRGTLRARHVRAGQTTFKRDATPEIIAARLSQLAIDMGLRLGATAVSVNVRERLDYSCALLDPQGGLSVHAPHVPVHLGSLGVCVRAIAVVHGSPRGAIFLTNHPAYGGSHLPDLTVAAPAHASDGTLVGWVANRAHHAEIGGRTPGSLPVDARCLEEEGVVLPPLRIATQGHVNLDAVEQALTQARWPSRRPAENLADLRAQIAAVRLGTERLTVLADELGPQNLRNALETIRSNGAGRMREALASLGAFHVTDSDQMDDGTPLQVSLKSNGERLTVDFSGTGARHAGNLNATPAIVRSAVLYALRVWLGGDLPLNEGVLEPVDIVLPEGCLLNPCFDLPTDQAPAVMGGNVETSQRVVDILLGALGLCARSQGTMNNLVFGDAQRSFYETIAGGGGATEQHAGRSCRHVHMTNTAITDPEILEERYPVRLLCFQRRYGSGGAGRNRGGDGVVREVKFLEPLTLSLLTQRRTTQPRGAQGGAPGASGAQFLRLPHADSELPLPHAYTSLVPAGSRLRMETPGGGGWGPGT